MEAVISKVNFSASRASRSPVQKLWRSAMENQHLAARRRRWAFIFLLILISALIAFRAPADHELLAKWLFSARSYGHLLMLGVAFWLAYRTAASSQQAIFQLDNLAEAQKHLWHSAFNGGYSTLRLQDGEIAAKNVNNPLLRMGGPGQIEANMETAAVVEPFNDSPRVIAPDKNNKFLSGFEQLRESIDLQDQIAILNLWGRTRDGIRVYVESARLVYSIERGKREASMREPHPFDQAAALRIAYDSRVETILPSKSSGNQFTSALAKLGSALFERQLQSFIAGLTLGELLSSSSSAESFEGDAERSGVLFLARDALRRNFVNYCRPTAKARGLDIHWVDLGNWKVDELAQEILEEFQAEQIHGFPKSEKSSYQDSRSQELNRLFAQLTQWDQDELEQADSAEIRSQLVNAYYGLFDGLKLRYGDLLGEDEQQIDIVLRFLKLLNKGIEKNH